jgi:hypothetical protein
MSKINIEISKIQRSQENQIISNLLNKIKICKSMEVKRFYVILNFKKKKKIKKLMIIHLQIFKRKNMKSLKFQRKQL